jgi:hypothetical protein
MFRVHLKSAGFPVDFVQCPCGVDRPGISAMRGHAVAFNLKKQVIAVDLTWTP